MARRPFHELNLLADHFPPLHGLRAIAIVSVLQIHVTITMGWAGLLRDPAFFVRSTSIWFGMDLFFILSGFLIGTLLLPAEDGRPRSGIGRFYLRRAFRIIPLYYVVLTAVAFIPPTLPAQRAGLFYEYAYLTNYHVFFPFPPVMPWGWSLCVEEHFYLAAPFLAALLTWLPKPSQRVGALVALWFAGLGVRLAVYLERPTPWTGGEMTDAMYTRTHTRFDVLIAGVLLAYLHRYYGDRIRALVQRPGMKLVLLAVPVLCAYVLLGPLALRRDLTTVFAWGTITSVMYVSLLLVVLSSGGPVIKWLSSRWFLRFATLGYGVYLVHPPLIAHVVIPAELLMMVKWQLPLGVAWPLGLALLVVVATATAYVLHLAVEKPALWLRDRLTGHDGGRPPMPPGPAGHDGGRPPMPPGPAGQERPPAPPAAETGALPPS